MGFTVKSDSIPPRGERIAAWVEHYMREHGLSVSELAFKVGADKRDVRRLLSDRSCGPRLNDDLEAAFGWDFIEQVATPVVGADPLTAREREVEQRLAQAAALHARIEREREVRAQAQAYVVGVAGAKAAPRARARRSSNPFNQEAPQGA